MRKQGDFVFGMPNRDTSEMQSTDVRKLLWENVAALMRYHWREENLNRLARAADLSPATAHRLKRQESSVGLDVIEAVAKVFRVKPWQLLQPTFDPANAGRKAAGDWPFARITQGQFNRMSAHDRQLVEGFIEAVLAQGAEARPGLPFTALSASERALVDGYVLGLLRNHRDE